LEDLIIKVGDPAKGIPEGYGIFFTASSHVETCVFLSNKKADTHININVEFGEGEGKIPVVTHA
jgi:23S rRNA (uracil1939-C5)-methyltransferase